MVGGALAKTRHSDDLVAERASSPAGSCRMFFEKLDRWLRPDGILPVFLAKA